MQTQEQRAAWHLKGASDINDFAGDAFLRGASGVIVPLGTLKNAAAPKTPCQKYAGQNSAVRQWTGPACATNR